MVDCAQRYELFECGIDAVAADMAVKKRTHLRSRQSVGGCVDGFEDTVRDVVASRCPEKEGGACGAVVPHREGSLKVRQPDAGATVENSVYGAEAQDLGFGPTGGGAVEIGTDLAQDRIALVPESSCLLVAAEADGVRIADPIQSAAQFGGDRR